MLKYFFVLFLGLINMAGFSQERILKDREAEQLIHGAALLRYTDHSAVPNYIQFRKDAQVNIEDLNTWLNTNFNTSNLYNLVELNRTTDQIGFEHIRYRQSYNNTPVQGSMLIAHTRNGKIESLSGVIYNNITVANSPNILSEGACLQIALAKVNAAQYKWQLPDEEAHLKQTSHNSSATYYPKGETFILKSNNIFHLCYAFNIYAQEPFGRTMEYIDMHSGESILSKNLIEHVNTNGTAVTKYSGTRVLQTDSTSPTNFRLRDASRGLGVETYNLNHTANYAGAVDFTDADNYWNNVNAAHDEAATDAHWGAQKTYDYFLAKHGRNSIDNAGFALNSYVHYNTNYANAFWDGTEMTYGDGSNSSGFMILTGLDVCGHEIGHGLVTYTCDLSATSSGTSQCDALNEAYADIMGTSVERFARPSQWDWKIGGDITCTSAGVPDGLGLRSMSNPLSFGDPNCYQGTNWSASGEPHANAGPLDHWFYLLSTGSAANNIASLGNDTAEYIAYRTLTVHLFPNATYADARFYSIVSSSELYGACSTPTIATTNAWSTVCVGTPYVAGPTVSNFSGDLLQTCDTTLTVNFSNSSTNGNTFIWYFGDGTTSTQYSPTHTYSSGTYSVKLVANGGTCGLDSLTQTAYIQVGPPPGPTTVGDTICSVGSTLITATPNNIADTIRWYAAASGGTSLYTGTNFTTPVLSSTTTYYAEEKVMAPAYHVGPLNNSIGTSANYTNTTRFLVFDCVAPTILKSVWVMATSAGNRTIIIKNAAGTTIQSVTVNIPNGGSVVNLNLPIPVGTGMQIGFATGSTVNVHRNSTGATYPYSNGPITITGNTAAGSASYYYFFYDWVLQGDPCYSQRTPTTVVVGSGTGPTPASITPLGPITVCAPNSVALNANTGSGLNYQWYKGTTLLSGATTSNYTATTSGNYSVQVNSISGCLTTGTSNTVAVNIDPAPSANITPAGPTTFCQGANVVLNANTGTGLSYQWTLNTTPIVGATTSSYTASQSGNYAVTVSNINLCNATSSPIAVTVNAIPTATLTPGGTITVCQSASTTLSANTGSGLSYQWYLNYNPISGATSSIYSASIVGSYFVIVNNGSNCGDTSSITTLLVNPLPTATINSSGATTFCQGANVVLDANTGSGLSYQWFVNSNPIVGATNYSYTAAASGNYYVQVSNLNCSANSNSIAVTVNALPPVNVTPSGSISICQGDSLLLNANTGSGFSYQWYMNTGAISGATNNTYTLNQAGNYNVVISNSNGCVDTSAMTTITVNPLPTPVISNASGVLSVSGGPYISYQWYYNGGAISGATNATYNATLNGSYTVDVVLNFCLGTSAPYVVITVGVDNIAANHVVLSPNPTTGIIHVDGNLPAKIIVRNVQGQIVKEVYYNAIVSLAEFANGLYFIQVFDEKGACLLNEKVSKQ